MSIVNLRLPLLGLAIMLIGLNFNASAQILSGGVLGPGNIHIPNAEIGFVKDQATFKTDSAGNFSIPYTQFDNDTLVVKAKGFETMSLAANKFSPGNTAILYLKFETIKAKPKKKWFWQRWFGSKG